jgi:hypothetical protein
LPDAFRPAGGLSSGIDTSSHELKSHLRVENLVVEVGGELPRVDIGSCSRIATAGLRAFAEKTP